ncbi:MAG TPA: hypothetical protein VHF69_12430 [Candidatus Synoicihabitans sp.]|nr:hypothetical protein [Candidatus Synoicihabitans sp.]
MIREAFYVGALIACAVAAICIAVIFAVAEDYFWSVSSLIIGSCILGMIRR